LLHLDEFGQSRQLLTVELSPRFGGIAAQFSRCTFFTSIQTTFVIYNTRMEKKSWLEVSLRVDGELAEAVAEVFARFAPGGVAVESTAIQSGSDEAGEPVGAMRVCAYLPADSQLEETRQKLAEALYFLGRIQPLPEPVYTPIEDQNWMEAWKQHYRPVEIGKKLLVLPAWLEMPETNRTPLRIDPGMAFGTGTHPTTKLSLMLLEKTLQPEDTLFDIGCGSGILAVAARKLGAGQVYGVDIDPQAVEIARQTARNNLVQEGLQFETGSVVEVRNGLFPVRQAPVVVANILTHILIRLLDDGLADLVASGGMLILSGILEEKEGEIRDALARKDLEISGKSTIEDWIGLEVQQG
jgi:ribosomal protein L11 methyltransferase